MLTLPLVLLALIHDAKEEVRTASRWWEYLSGTVWISEALRRRKPRGGGGGFGRCPRCHLTVGSNLDLGNRYQYLRQTLLFSPLMAPDTSDNAYITLRVACLPQLSSDEIQH